MQAAAVCLDDNQAAEFATGSLASTEAAKVEAHLAGCRDCRSLVAALAGASEDSDIATSPRAHGLAGFSPTVPAHPGARAAATVGAFAVGDRIGRYIVLGRLGQGGMGVVLSAYDPQLDRKVAIKVLRTGTGVATGEARARMIREAKAIAQLSHPNVVSVYDVGTADPGDVYIAMEFVEGDTLTAWQRRFDRPWREVLDVFLQAGRGLAAAHGAGLLHRDFKPDNVLVGADGRVRVGDFGLARTIVGPDDGRAIEPPMVAAALQGSLTATGAIVGTPRYMAPETFRGKDSDARSDQFSYCVALYEALFGKHPIEGDTALAMIEGGAGALPPPEGHRIPASIVRAVLRGLDDVPAKRFPSMAVLIAELTPPPVRAPRKMLLALGAGVLALGAVAAVAAVLRGGESGPSQREQVLTQKIEQLQKERDDLIAQVKAGTKDKAELVEKIKQKDQQIQVLLEQAATDTPLPPPEPPNLGTMPTVSVKRPPPKDVGKPVADKLRTADLSGCFDEWSRRNPNTSAHLTVSLKVSPGGVSHDIDPKGIDDASLPFCVGEAIEGVKVPAPGQSLQLEVGVAFVGGVITIDPHVLGAQRAEPSIDLDTMGRPQSQLIDR